MENDLDISRELCLDGNAVAGLLQEIFAGEMTTSPAQCATCRNVGELGSLRAYTQGPGVVLRCPICGGIVMRLVATPQSIYLDVRGAIYFRMDRGLSRGSG